MKDKLEVTKGCWLSKVEWDAHTAWIKGRHKKWMADPGNYKAFKKFLESLEESSKEKLKEENK